jgi:hypothetical protein
VRLSGHNKARRKQQRPGCSAGAHCDRRGETPSIPEAGCRVSRAYCPIFLLTAFFLLDQGFLLLFGDMAAVLAGRGVFFVANLVVFVVQLIGGEDTIRNLTHV